MAVLAAMKGYTHISKRAQRLLTGGTDLAGQSRNDVVLVSVFDVRLALAADGQVLGRGPVAGSRSGVILSREGEQAIQDLFI